MASSSWMPRTWRYHVFTSFHGPDVRKTFLSHLRKQFNYNGITMFDDQGIERGHTIAPSLTQAIRESKISIVVLSKNYVSSSWCLDELVEILDCKEAIGQIVMTVFYGIDPCDVRKQTGEFGRAFNETCARKTEEDRKRWSLALEAMGNIAGEHFLNWDNEAEMIEKIAKDVSHKLNATPSRDFDGIVGLEAHLREMQSLLDLDYNGVKIVAIYGPAGIGKTTIARALHSLISYKFQLNCFMENIRRSYHSGLDEYGLKLRLQEHLLSSIFNQDGTRVYHLGTIRERLCDLKVLIILDDVNDVKQLEALANENTWFGPGSRIIVTTENKDLLQRHGINNTYLVGFPSDEEALKILCRYAVIKSSPCPGFKILALRVINLCGNLPLGLRVVGSCLQGENEDKWEYMIRRLQIDIDRDIEDVLRIGYESLNENEQTLFLHIAVFFNHKDGGLVKAMLAGNNLDIEFGLEILVNRSLIYISTNGKIVMHKLLQQVGMQAIQRQEPWKRQILTNAQEICDVLENDTGTRTLSGISFNTSGINEVTISKRALRRMSNLRFLCVYKTINDGNDRVHIPEEMEFPPRLRLLHWEVYPSKSLPLRLCMQYLVELNMGNSRLEKLWEGTQPLTNLKKMNLSWSAHLKELPDLSNATNLERLDMGYCEALVEVPASIGNLHKLEYLWMSGCKSLKTIPTHINLASLVWLNMDECSSLRTFPNFSTNIERLHLKRTSLVEIPSSIGNLQKLKRLWMNDCKSLEVIPTHINLASLEQLDMSGCSRLRSFPDFSTNIETLDLMCTATEKVPASIKHWSRLSDIRISGNGILTTFTNFPECVRSLDLSNTDIEKIPNCIHGFQRLECLNLKCCRKLTSLPELPGSLRWLEAKDCESLQRVTSPLNTQYTVLIFTNCFKLSGEARRLIIQGSYIDGHVDGFAFLPGRVMPSEFNHRARGNYLTIPLSFASSSKFKACVLISPNQPQYNRGRICVDIRCIVGSYTKVIPIEEAYATPGVRTDHLCIFHGDMPKVSSETKFEFNFCFRDYFEDCEIEDTLLCQFEIIECGVRIMTDEPERTNKDYDDSSYEFELNEVLEDSENVVISCDSEPENVGQEKHITDCWSWLFICFDLSNIVKNIGRLCWGRKQMKSSS